MPKDIWVTEGFQISEDIPVLGGVQVAESIRVPEDIRVPEHFRVLDRKKLKLPDPTRPENMFYPHTSNKYALKILIDPSR